MATMIYKSDFRFHEITEEYKENFKETSWHDLSDFQVVGLGVLSIDTPIKDATYLGFYAIRRCVDENEILNRF